PIAVRSQVDGDLTTVELEFEERRPLHHRVVRLWSVDRPWEDAITEPIADDRVGSAEISRRDRIPPGGYLVEVAIDDGWLKPSRPRSGSRNTASTQVGSAQEWRDRLRALERLDDPFAALEVTAATGSVPRQLATEDLRRIGGAAFDAACAWIEEGEGTAST